MEKDKMQIRDRIMLIFKKIKIETMKSISNHKIIFKIHPMNNCYQSIYS